MKMIFIVLSLFLSVAHAVDPRMSRDLRGIERFRQEQAANAAQSGFPQLAAKIESLLQLIRMPAWNEQTRAYEPFWKTLNLENSEVDIKKFLKNPEPLTAENFDQHLAILWKLGKEQPDTLAKLLQNTDYLKNLTSYHSGYSVSVHMVHRNLIYCLQRFVMNVYLPIPELPNRPTTPSAERRSVHGSMSTTTSTPTQRQEYVEPVNSMTTAFNNPASPYYNNTCETILTAAVVNNFFNSN